MKEVLPQLLATGLVNTLIISVAATLLSTLFGLLLAMMGISPSRWLRLPARLYTDRFRGLPSILTILLIGQGLARFSYQLFSPTPYPLGIFALSLIASAYDGRDFSRRYSERRARPDGGVPRAGHELRARHAAGGDPAGHPPRAARYSLTSLLPSSKTPRWSICSA